MPTGKIKMFNVYAKIFPEKIQEYHLEYWDGDGWKGINRPEEEAFGSLEFVAKKIAQLSEKGELSKRIMFEGKSFTGHRPEGISLKGNEAHLIDSLHRIEKIQLLYLIDNYVKNF